MKKIFFAFFITVVFSLFFYSFAIAKDIDSIEDLPEKNGVYPVRGHPELKLRVFVHPGRGNHPGKPTPTATLAPVLNCSLSDPDSTAINGITGWHLPSTFGYYLNPGSVPSSVGSQNLATIVANGFHEWTQAIGNKVSINPVGTTSQNRARYDGLNIISWGRASSGTLGVTYTWYYTSSGLVAEVDTIMNKSYLWRWSDPSTWNNGQYCAFSASYDAQDILTHELGHWLGVDDEYDDVFADNTMYGYGDVEETKKDTLTTGDTTAVSGIYH